jgi:arylsulfatase A-like enzyme
MLSGNSAEAATTPNILVILVDDLGYHDLGCQGATDFKTPQIDKLAASGARCTAGYVTAPQCSPSRAGLMTGMNQSRFGYVENLNHHGLPPRSVVELLPEQMKQLGYATAIIGKWHIGERVEGGPGWDYFPGSAPWDRGFDLSVLISFGQSHYLPYSKEGKNMMSRGDRPFWLVEKSPADTAPRPLKDLPADTYLTEYFSRRASSFIRKNQQKPWFLYLAYNAPHTPLTPIKSDLAAHSAITDKNRQQFAAIMTGLDRELGNVLATLDETRQRERTLVWFISDNGGPTFQNASRNDPFPGHKGDTWEGGVRVPFLVSWPGQIPAGQTFDRMISTLDVLPTSLAAAGKTDVAPIHEGKNLLPHLTGNVSSEAHDALFWHWRNRCAARVGNLKENRNGPAEHADKEKAPPLPDHMFNDFGVNPFENPAQPLTDEAKQAQVKTALDAWLKKLETDAARISRSNDAPSSER